MNIKEEYKNDRFGPSFSCTYLLSTAHSSPYKPIHKQQGKTLTILKVDCTPCENKTPTGKGEMGRIGSTQLFGPLSLSCLSSIFARGTPNLLRYVATLVDRAAELDIESLREIVILQSMLLLLFLWPQFPLPHSSLPSPFCSLAASCHHKARNGRYPRKKSTENYYLVCFVLVKGVLLRILLSSSSVYHVNVFIEMLLLIYEIVKPH